MVIPVTGAEYNRLQTAYPGAAGAGCTRPLKASPERADSQPGMRRCYLVRGRLRLGFRSLRA